MLCFNYTVRFLKSVPVLSRLFSTDRSATGHRPGTVRGRGRRRKTVHTKAGNNSSAVSADATLPAPFDVDGRRPIAANDPRPHLTGARSSSRPQASFVIDDGYRQQDRCASGSDYRSAATASSETPNSAPPAAAVTCRRCRRPDCAAASLKPANRSPTTAPHSLPNFSPIDSALRANPSAEGTDQFCRLPLSTFVYQPEAVHLGDLLRIWVRPGARFTPSPPDFQGPARAHRTPPEPRRFPRHGPLSRGEPIPGRPALHKEKRTLPGAPAGFSGIGCVTALDASRRPSPPLRIRGSEPDSLSIG